MPKTLERPRQKIITELREQVFELTAQLQRCGGERDAYWDLAQRGRAETTKTETKESKP